MVWIRQCQSDSLDVHIQNSGVDCEATDNAVYTSQICQIPSSSRQLIQLLWLRCFQQTCTACLLELYRFPKIRTWVLLLVKCQKCKEVWLLITENTVTFACYIPQNGLKRTSINVKKWQVISEYLAELSVKLFGWIFDQIILSQNPYYSVWIEYSVILPNIFDFHWTFSYLIQHFPG